MGRSRLWRRTWKKSEIKEPKKHIVKDKHGEIIITKLEAYVEPVRAVKEVRTDMKTRNNYDFGDLSIDEDEEVDDTQQIKEEIEDEEEEVEITKKKNKKEKKQDANLDDIFAELGSK